MKIIILSPGNSVVGGVERFSNYLAQAYADLGEVKILTPRNNIFDKIFKILGLSPVYNGLKLGHLARKEGFDILVTNGLLGWNLKSGKIINIQHGTYAASAQRIDFGRNYFKWFMKRFVWGAFERIAAQRASKVVAVSQDTADNVVKYYGVEDILVVPNAIDGHLFKAMDKIACRNHFNLPLDKKLIVFAGRFEYAKGADIMLDIIAGSDHNKVNLVVAADTKIEYPGIISLINVSYQELPQFYNAGDLYILPSRHEGFSLALLEALNCGLPYLITPVGSAKEISAIDSENIVDLDNFSKLAIKKIEETTGPINHSELLQNFSLSNFQGAYRQILKSL